MINTNSGVFHFLFFSFLFPVHFRNFTTIHSGYQGEGDVEVLAYVNSNLIVVHPDSNPNEQSEKQFHNNEKPNLPLIQVPSYSKNDKQNTLSSSSSSSSTSTRSSSRTQVPAADDITQNQSINSDKYSNSNSVTEKSNKAVIISKEILENVKKETTKEEEEDQGVEKGKQTADITNNAKVETKKPTVAKVKSTDIQNFTVDGWPESKSRSAEDYVNYSEPTEILLPQKPFSSASAGNL